MISAPDDYGLTPEQTLAHTAQSQWPEHSENYWEGCREAVETLSTRWVGSIDSAINRVLIPSLGSTRVVGQISMPVNATQDPTRGVVITTHGYGDVPDDFVEDADAWTEHSLVTLQLRVRGFPPSTMDIGDLRGDWILHKIESAEQWILRGAVADLVQAFRCARRHFGANTPISIHGESFGGGLAVIAAAQLTLLGDPPFRMVLGLPSLGDWAWRAGRYCNGAGGQVNMLLDAYRGQARDDLLTKLLLFDAALHAQNVTCPVLCKLAQRDDTVPAPSAAAVFNALGSAEKWRCVTRYGHFDGGISDGRRHALFERLHPHFLDPFKNAREVASEAPAELQVV